MKCQREALESLRQATGHVTTVAKGDDHEGIPGVQGVDCLTSEQPASGATWKPHRVPFNAMMKEELTSLNEAGKVE